MPAYPPTYLPACRLDCAGPTTCYAVRYALGDNKTALGHVPEQKAFIRGR